MPTVLLPSSAAAFAPRCSPNVVLKTTKVEPWLTATLKRVNRVKRPLNNVTQHTKCLTETLSSPNALWTLCSIMVPKAAETELRKDDNALVEALFNYQMLHVEAYVVHVDMVSQNEVAFKLTPETIEALVDFHKEVYSVDTAASTWDWAEKESQLKSLQEEFVQAANKFVYRTNVHALEGLEEDGAGELLCGRSEEAKAMIMSLFVPLLPPPPPPPPPPPRIVDVIPAVSLLPTSVASEVWWDGPALQSSPPMGSWKMQSPSTTTASATSIADSLPNLWASSAASLDFTTEAHMPSSPALSYSPPPPYTAMPCPTTTAQYYSAAAATSAAFAVLPLPSMLIQPCSTAASMAGFGWGERYQDSALSYGTIM